MVNHLRIHHSIVSQAFFLNPFAMAWAMPLSFSLVVHSWVLRLKSAFDRRGDILWRFLLFAIRLGVWNEHNDTIFEGPTCDLPKLRDRFISFIYFYFISGLRIWKCLKESIFETLYWTGGFFFSYFIFVKPFCCTALCSPYLCEAFFLYSSYSSLFSFIENLFLSLKKCIHMAYNCLSAFTLTMLDTDFEVSWLADACNFRVQPP